MGLKEKLNTAKNLVNETPASTRRVPRQSVQPFTGSVESLTNTVFGKADRVVYDDNGHQVYDPDEEMKRISQGLPKDTSNCKLPDFIKESIISNPLIMSSVDPKMDSFTEALAQKIPGVSKVAAVMNRVDEADREKEVARKAAINEVSQHATAAVDYGLIKSIVENAVNSLREEFRNELNESVNRSRSRDTSLAAMKMTDKFLFLDNDNNVFECQMVYRGKNKKKN